MGEIAEMMLDGTLDEQTGEYIGEAVGYPRTNQKGYYNTIQEPRNTKKYSKSTKAIRKELAILIKKRLKDKIPNVVEGARQAINIKYGKGWREQF